MAYNEKFLLEAINLSIENVQNGTGGPFGAIIVKDGEIISTGVNKVTSSNDPTAHAEIDAIRSACSKLNDFLLKDCEIYTSCEPCPMCLSAIYWAHIEKIYYANTREDAEKINFSDNLIYNEINLKPHERTIPAEQHLRDKAILAFKLWESSENKISY